MIRRSLAAIALAFLPALAFADPGGQIEQVKDRAFVFVGTTSGDIPVQAYVERPTAAPVEGLITVWTISVARPDQRVAGRLGVVLLAPQTFDCKSRLFRWGDSELIDGDDGLIRDTPTQGDWTPVQAGSANELSLWVACGEGDSDEPSLVGLPAVRADAGSREFD